VSDEARATERPATFREVFANSEFRAVYGAVNLSWFGDYLAKAAVTALVYDRTGSVALSAITFALSFLPWAVGGPVLAALADRYRYRTVMVVCDLLRMVLIALVAVPHIPVWAMLVLLFLTSLANPPAQGAKSALMPLILTKDRLVVGLALNTSTAQAAQIGGYVAGAAMAPFFPRLALIIDAATFAISAMLVRFGVRDRPPATALAHRRHIMKETAEGFGLVFGTPVLRAIAVMVFAVMLFSIVPEGLAVAWAADVAKSDAERGAIQGLIMAANPIGFILGGLLITRLVRPARRQKLIRPFAVLAPLALVPALLAPSPAWIAAIAALCGFAVAGMMPTANGLFVQALPHGYRARAFGVMQSGVQIMQGLAVLGTGLLADVFPLHTVVGIWSAAGVLLMIAVTARWPSPSSFAAAIARVNRAGQPVELEDTTVDLQDHAIKMQSRDAEVSAGAADPQAAPSARRPIGAHRAPEDPHSDPGTRPVSPATDANAAV